MKSILLVMIAGMVAISTNAQQVNADTNYFIRIISVEWMPTGKQLLLSAIKFHKHNRRYKMTNPGVLFVSMVHIKNE